MLRNSRAFGAVLACVGTVEFSRDAEAQTMPSPADGSVVARDASVQVSGDASRDSGAVVDAAVADAVVPMATMDAGVAAISNSDASISAHTHEHPHNEHSHDEQAHPEHTLVHAAGLAHEHDEHHDHPVPRRPVPNAEPVEQTVTVRGDRSFSTASSVAVRERDLAARPRFRPADLLEVAPGLMVVQHAGGGKANQYFLRGFDADHGTDIALSVDGVPFNNVSHGHGQGYADPHFIIPELVERVDVQEGPYFANSGDFATAGAIDLRLRRTVQRSSVSLEAGRFGQYRFLGIVRTDVGPIRGYVAGELAHVDGPFLNPQDFNRFNIVGRWTASLTRAVDLILTVNSYAGAWNASGQVPTRLIDQPYMGRVFSQFDSIDPTEGGQSERHSIAAEVRARSTDGSELSVMLYALHYRLNLFSNFTFFANDSMRGDQIEQNDSRTVGGFKASYRAHQHIGSWRFETYAGAQLRVDSVDNALRTAQARVRTATTGHWEIQQASMGIFAQEEVQPIRWLRVIAGIRADLYHFAVEDQGNGVMPPDPMQTGTRQAGILSPKATVAFTPVTNLDFYLNYGSGFHSNDARGVIRRTQSVTPLARAHGYEVGARWHTIPRLELAASGWGVDIDSEIVWVGDEGTTEPRGPSRRLGFTLEGRLDITPWLRVDADLSLVNAVFTQAPVTSNAIPLAPWMTLSAGVSVNHPVGVFGAVRLRAISDRPANEDRSLTAQGFAILSAQAGYKHRWFEAALSAENLTNSLWREAQFATDSRLPSEAMPVSDVSFTPGTPISINGRVTVFLP